MRKFNYTGRQKINRDNIDLRIQENGETFTFFAAIDTSNLKLPPDANIFIEAYFQTDWMRFKLGTVSNQYLPHNTVLAQFETIQNILFRINIVSANEGKLLAHADRISPSLPKDEIDNSRISLLPVISKSLEGNLWQITYTSDSDDRPILEIEEKLGDRNSIIYHPLFTSFVLPTAFKEILIRIASSDEEIDHDDLTDWRSQWIKFNAHLGNDFIDPKNDYDAISEWANECTGKLCRKQNLSETFVSWLNEKETNI